MRVDEVVERGRAALRAGNAVAARDAIAGVTGEASEQGDILEIRARADYLDLRFAEAIANWERAYAAHRAAGDQLGAIRVARTLAGMYHALRGDVAVSAGWQARAQTLLGDAGETSERGWVALNAAMFEPDRTAKTERLRDALACARRMGDIALEVATLGYLGASLVHGGHAAEGMRLLDEALAAIAGGEVDDFMVLEEVFCQLFSACEHVRDVRRADEWMRIGDAIATRRNLPSVAGFCRTHFGGLLTTAGRWREADEALTDAVRLWDLGRRSLLRGGALVRLADLRIRQGRVDEAEELLTDLDPMLAIEASRPRAAIHLAKGEFALARDVVERALESVDPEGCDAAPLYELLVDGLLASGDVTGAEAAADRLAAVAERHQSEFVRALASLARGRVCLATATGDPQACLRDALDGFGRADAPLEMARVRLELATAAAEERPDVALVEARAALDAFERLQAARHADAAAALLRRLGVRPSTARRAAGTVLTKREAEVLELLGRGLSNPEIGDRLYISRKTVEHHVGNVLAKLGLRSRAEAAAFAVRRPAAPTGEPASD